MDTKNITHTSTTLWINVETEHGDRCEFVLDRARDRTDTDYYNELEKMLDYNLSVWGDLREVDCYYKVIVSVDVKDANNIPRVLDICNKTVARWKARFNVDRMIPINT